MRPDVKIHAFSVLVKIEVGPPLCDPTLRFRPLLGYGAGYSDVLQRAITCGSCRRIRLPETIIVGRAYRP